MAWGLLRWRSRVGSSHEECRQWSQATCVSSSTLPLTIWVESGKLFNLCLPPLLYPQNEAYYRISVRIKFVNTGQVSQTMWHKLKA